MHRPLGISDERFQGGLVTLGSAGNTALLDAFAAMPAHLHGSPSTLGIVGSITSWTDYDGWPETLKRTIVARFERMLEGFGVVLSIGHQFGPNGAGSARNNVATSEEILDRAIGRIAMAVDQSSMAW